MKIPTTTLALLIPSLVAAARHSKLGRLHTRDSHDYTEYDTWAGAIQYGKDITDVSASFIVPAVFLPANSKPGYEYSGVAWVGIDGTSCQTALLQTGIEWVVTDDKTVYTAFYEWYPTGSIDFPDFALSQGDLIRARVVSHGVSSGTAYITNESTGQTVSHTFTDQASLCLTSAEWIVEDSAGFSTKPFADFGQVVFDETKYVAPAGPGNLDGATIVDMRQDGVMLADCRISEEEDSVACSYVGPRK